MVCSDTAITASNPSNLDKSSILTEKTTDYEEMWDFTSDPGADLCIETIDIKLYDGTTDGKAIVRFKFTAERLLAVPDDGNDYDDFDYTFSTYNTQMYMGYNDFSDDSSDLSCTDCRYWDGDSSSSTTAVDFDVWNQEATILEDDAALSGIFSVSSGIIAAAALVFNF